MAKIIKIIIWIIEIITNFAADSSFYVKLKNFMLCC